MSKSVALEQRRQTQIRKLCKLAGRPDDAKSCIDLKMTVAQTIIALSVSAGLGNDSSDSQFRAEFQKDRDQYEALGMSESDYVMTRRIDDGLESCEPDFFATDKRN